MRTFGECTTWETFKDKEKNKERFATVAITVAMILALFLAQLKDNDIEDRNETFGEVT